MLMIICLFFPAFILIDKYNNVLDYIKEYFVSNVKINTLVFFVLFMIKRNEVFYLNTDVFTLSFSFKYLAISMVIAYFIKIISKNFKVKFKFIKENNNEEK